MVMEQDSLTHFPSQPWCKMCVESRGRDSPHREQSKIDAVVPQLQFDCGYMGDGCPLQSHPRDDGARLQEYGHAPCCCRNTAKWVRDLVYERFCLHGDTRRSSSLQLLLDKLTKDCRPKGQDWQFLRQVSPTQSHHSNGAAEKAAVSTVRGLAGTFLTVLVKTKSRLLR